MRSCFSSNRLAVHKEAYGGVVKFHENNNPAGTSRDMGELTTLYTEKSIAWLKEKRDPEKPFVLYLAHTMMHTIIDASNRFRGNSEGGLYGDVVEEFDFETGRLLDALDELGVSKNTLVIYTSDNGPWNQEKYTKNKKGPHLSLVGKVGKLIQIRKVHLSAN